MVGCNTRLMKRYSCHLLEHEKKIQSNSIEFIRSSHLIYWSFLHGIEFSIWTRHSEKVSAGSLDHWKTINTLKKITNLDTWVANEHHWTRCTKSIQIALLLIGLFMLYKGIKAYNTVIPDPNDPNVKNRDWASMVAYILLGVILLYITKEIPSFLYTSGWQSIRSYCDLPICFGVFLKNWSSQQVPVVWGITHSPNLRSSKWFVSKIQCSEWYVFFAWVQFTCLHL